MVAETKLYDILAISPTASTEEISKSYKKIALKCHPDKNNHDPQLTEKFKIATRAYEVLRDSSTRQTYDRYGEAGIEGGVLTPSHTHSTPNNFKFKSATEVFSQVFNDINSTMNQPFGGFGFGMDMDMGMNMNMGFNMGFGGFGNRRPQQQQQHPPGQFPPGPRPPSHQTPWNANKVYKSKDIYHTCKLSLEDMAFGKTIKLQLPRRTKCDTCKGEGGFQRGLCRTCQGSGRTITVSMNQFSKFQEISLCRDCSGTGTVFSSQCGECDDGYKVVNKLINLQILPGTEDNSKIIIKGAADEARNMIPGDVIVKIKQTSHPYIVRKSNDLYMEYDIDLKTALLGGWILIKDFLKKGNDLRVYINVHGDATLNNNLDASIQKGEVTGTINPGTPKVVKGFGMPINKEFKDGAYYHTDDNKKDDFNSYKRGDLFIKFNVQLPTIDQYKNGIDDLMALSNILPQGPQQTSNSGNITDSYLGNLPHHTGTQSFKPSPQKLASLSSNEDDDIPIEVPEFKRQRGS